jgi:23S rRNA pseudouridine1911/1915/1917 synthase
MMTKPPSIPDVVEFSVDAEEDGLRLDVFLAGRLDELSRTAIQHAIKAGAARVGNRAALRPSRHVRIGETISFDVPALHTISLEPQDIPLDILFEDPDVLVVNKPAGLVVHPAPGHPSGTLVNAVLFHCKDFERPGDEAGASVRPGIVHRLDRDTSGVMVVAKSRRAFESLAQQAREHRFERRYVALVKGEFTEDAGVIRAAIGRSTADRKKMGINAPEAREAVTRYAVLERFGVASLISLQLETGRTHQIRVHLRFVGRPVLGDPLYGVTDFSGWAVSRDLRAALEALRGQALHAEMLGFEHPRSGNLVRFTTPMPGDFQAAVAALRDHNGVNVA